MLAGREKRGGYGCAKDSKFQSKAGSRLVSCVHARVWLPLPPAGFPMAAGPKKRSVAF